MNARAVEHAEGRLHELKALSIGGGALALGTFSAALAATQLHPELAVPLLLGAMTVALVAMRAFVRASLLVEDVAADTDALTIPEVRRYALRISAPERRRRLAASIRSALDASHGDVPRVEANRDRLEELEAALLDERLALDPALAVALDGLSTRGWDTFYGSTVPPDELRSSLQRILTGFRPASTA
jgi:hypothetical protein